MRIKKILNNNVALSTNEKREEIILVGRGICFKKKIGDSVLNNQIEKEFVLKNPEVRDKFQLIITETPYLYIKIAEQIIDRAKSVYAKTLNENIYLSLPDHIYCTVQRVEQGLSLGGTNMFWDLPWMYPEEYKIGEWGRKLIQEKLKIDLPTEESAFIALHIITAVTNENINHVINITKIVSDIVEIIQYHFNIQFESKDLDCYRLITHLKFFSQRIVQRYIRHDDLEEDFFKSLKTKYALTFSCVKKIIKYIESTYQFSVNEDEQLYLTIHIERLIQTYKTKISYKKT